MNILKTENNLDIDLKFRDKLEWFGKLSCNMTDKLQSLLYLSENYTASVNLKKFINEITGLWISVNKKVKLYDLNLLYIYIYIYEKEREKERVFTELIYYYTDL